MMYLADVLKHCGRFCEVTTKDARLFGTLLQFSATAVFVRRRVDSESHIEVVDASDIVDVIPLEDPHL